MRIRRIVPRRYPAKQDPEKVKKFIPFYEIIEEGPIPIWFFDESGIDVNDKPRKILARQGTKPTIPYTGDHIRENILGAVKPETGQLETLIMPYSNTDTFQYFLDYFNTRLEESFCFMILDNAGWHKRKSLKWGKVIPIYLPPYSPNLNAIEPLWKEIKDKLGMVQLISTNEELQDRICHEIRKLLNNPEEVKSFCKICEKIS